MVSFTLDKTLQYILFVFSCLRNKHFFFHFNKLFSESHITFDIQYVSIVVYFYLLNIIVKPKSSISSKHLQISIEQKLLNYKLYIKYFEPIYISNFIWYIIKIQLVKYQLQENLNRYFEQIFNEFPCLYRIKSNVMYTFFGSGL